VAFCVGDGDSRGPYSTYSLCSLCQSSSDSFEYPVKVFFFPSGRRTYAGADFVMSTVYTVKYQSPVHTQKNTGKFETTHIPFLLEL
jgi:hypothetical protein